MIHVQHLSLAFGSQIIFDNLTFTVGGDQRIGLVGRNGSGKSTLLKLIAQADVDYDGSIAILNGKKIAYMAQDVVLQSKKSVIDEAFSTFQSVVSLQTEIDSLALALEKDPDSIQLISDYAQATFALAQENPQELRAEAKKMLAGLGFSDAQMIGPVSSLSVGWKIRLVLAKLLLQKADFYLFDEPTNHLDLFAKEWFLQFLKKSSFGFLIVCHERYFLNELCSDILELERSHGTMYHGNYDSYVAQKEQRELVSMQAYTRQQKEIEQKKKFIERFRASASSAKRAQSMIKKLEKMEMVQAPLGEQKRILLQYGTVERSGAVVLSACDVSYSFGDKRLFESVSFEINRGDKVGLVACNGVGKTTLLRLIMGKYRASAGTITFGHNVRTAFFEQDQNEVLDFNKTVLEEVEHAAPKKTTAMVRASLGAFLFSGDDVHKKIGVLSGGEKNRVAMIKVLLSDANFLILDEPTNHLDIESKEILLSALKNFPGTILFVSHDRDFLNELATKIVELTPSGGHSYEGNFDSYLYQKNGVALKKEAVKPVPLQQNREFSAKQRYEMHKVARRAQEKIERLQKEMAQLQEKRTHACYDSPEWQELSKKMKVTEDALTVATSEWERAAQELEGIEKG